MTEPFISTETTRLMGMVTCGLSGGMFFASVLTEGNVQFRIACALAVIGLALLLRSLGPP